MARRPEFTALVLERIEASGKKKTEIALEMDVSPATISNIVSGRIPDEETIRKLAPVIGVTEEKLLALAGYLPDRCEIISEDPLIIARRSSNEAWSEEAWKEVDQFLHEMEEKYRRKKEPPQ
jgi:transcriptional regulator with XRE-family HTH domain